MRFSSAFLALALSASIANAYWLMGMDDIAKERIDPIVNPGDVSGHTHIIFGGSNFGLEVSTAHLQKSVCTSTPIVEDKSNYWAPLLYFQWANGSFSSLDGGAVIYYLYPNKPGATTAFPRDFRMISGNPTKRTYDANDPAHRAIDFLCLDFQGQTTKHHGLPTQHCPSGIRSQINFPSCWDGKNVDSPDHKSHVAYRSGGPDSGECTDPKFPVSIPRIFMEIYWDTGAFDRYRSQAKNPNQPFVFAYGDDTGYGNHADVYNGWDDGVLQRAIDGCHCNDFGDPQCCADRKIFTLKPKGSKCAITPRINERTTGTLSKLPGRNPVQPAGKTATMFRDAVIPALISPVFAYTGDHPTQTGTVVGAPQTVGTPEPTGGASSNPTPPAPSSTANPTSPTSTATAVPTSAPTSAPSSVPGTPSTVSPPPPPPPSSSNTGSPSSGSNTATKPVSSSDGGVKPPSPPTPTPSNTANPVPTSRPAPPPPGTVTGTGTGDGKPTSATVLPTTGPVPTTTPTRPPSSPVVTGPAKPIYTTICRKKKKKNVLPPVKKNTFHKKPGHHGGHKHQHASGHHGRSGLSRRNLQRRYDFDVDDYYY